jgi:uncharacterized protein YnzC (UPF0291/DUF896 family)
MIDKIRYQRVCPCCDKRFETTSSIKYYLNSAHQKKANDITQNEKRKQFQKMNKPMNDTYNIYMKLLGKQKEVEKSKEFLRGRGANLEFSSHIDVYRGNLTHFLHDIAVIELGNNFKLVKL